MFERRDSKYILRGYSLQLDRTKFKISAYAKFRNLTVPKTENTWKKLNQLEQEQRKVDSPKDMTTQARQTYHSSSEVDYLQPHRDYVPYSVPFTEDRKFCYIPKSISDFFDDEFDYRFIENCDELKDIAVAFFIGLMQPYDVPSSGGGGQSDSS